MPKSHHCQNCDSVFFHGLSHNWETPQKNVCLFFCSECGTQYLGEMRRFESKEGLEFKVRTGGTILKSDDCENGINEFVLLDAPIIAETTFRDFLSEWGKQAECINCNAVGKFIRPKYEFNNICPVCGSEDLKEIFYMR